MNQESDMAGGSTPVVGSAGADERVSILVGDRLCVSCAFNLAGQSVVREPHYRMLIVRCPECGTAASLQEFPILGKWAARWGGLLAAAWLVVMLVFTMGTAGAIFGMSFGVSSFACQPLVKFISEEHARWAKPERDSQNQATLDGLLKKQEEARAAFEAADVALRASPDSELASNERVTAQANHNAATTAVTNMQASIAQQEQWQAYYDSNWLTTKWIEQQDVAALVARARAAGAIYSAEAIKLWLLLALIAFVLGVLWSVAMLHAHARRKAIVCLVILALVAGMVGIQRNVGGTSTTFVGTAQMELASDLVSRLMGLKPILLSATLAIVPLYVGMLVGRRIARGVVRLLLPPRLRGALATLWITDGLRPPSPG